MNSRRTTVIILGLASAIFCRCAASTQDTDFVEQEKHLLKAVAAAEKRFGPDAAQMGESLGDLSGLYRNNGRSDEDSMIHERMLDTFVRNNPNWRGLCPGGPFLRIGFPGDKSEYMKPRSILSSWLNRKTLPRFYAKQQITFHDYRKSYETALAASEKTGPPGVIATKLEGLANLYCGQASFTRAEPLYERALALRDGDLAFSMLDYKNLVRNLDSLAAVYRMEGKDADAKRLEQRLEKLRHSPACGS